MPTEVTGEQFVEFLGKSELVSSDEADSLYARWRNEVGDEGTVQQFADWLVSRDVLSTWHASKLLQGKYRGFILDRYKLIRHLGSGGMSSVYLAEHRSLGQLRAIKVLPESRVGHSSMLERFYLEAKSVASLDHPNVVRVYDVAQAGTTHYIVMEYLDGKNLAQIVQERGPLSIDDAIEYVVEAARGLAYAHHTHLIHRDVKPGNLILTERKAIKLVDLGLALVKSEDDHSLTQVYNERVLGTADYLAPEQALSSHDVDGRADIYSLGCTFYFLLAGHPPFPDGTLPQRIVAHQTKPPRDIRELRADVSPALSGILNTMLAKKAEDRYQSMDEVIAALEALQHAADPSQAVASVPPVLRAVATPVATPQPGTVTPPPRRVPGSAVGHNSDIQLGEADTSPTASAKTVPGPGGPPPRGTGSGIRRPLVPGSRGPVGSGSGGVSGSSSDIGPLGIPLPRAAGGSGRRESGLSGPLRSRADSGVESGPASNGGSSRPIGPVGPVPAHAVRVGLEGPPRLSGRTGPRGPGAVATSTPAKAKSEKPALSWTTLTPLTIAIYAGAIIAIGVVIGVMFVMVVLAIVR